MRKEDSILKDFFFLVEYFGERSEILDSWEYRKDISAFLLHAHHISAYEFIAPFCRDKLVLDVGCFIGCGALRLSPFAKRIIAIDLDAGALQFAHSKRTIPNAIFGRADATQMPYSDNSFDIVVASQLVEHIPPQKVKNFFAEVKRVLKKGGSLFIITPNKKFRLLPFQKPFNPEHYQEFTRRSLRRKMKAFFKDVEVKGVRAKYWIETIERERVRQSPYQVYMWNPLRKVINLMLPENIREILRKNKKIFCTDGVNKINSEDQFEDMIRRFSLNDFYLADENIEDAMDLFAVCKK